MQLGHRRPSTGKESCHLSTSVIIVSTESVTFFPFQESALTLTVMRAEGSEVPSRLRETTKNWCKALVFRSVTWAKGVETFLFCGKEHGKPDYCRGIAHIHITLGIENGNPVLCLLTVFPRKRLAWLELL